MRWVCTAVLAGLLVPGAAGQGSPAVNAPGAKAAEVLLPGAAYDVATIKPSDPNAMGGGGGPRPNGGFYTKNQPLKYAVCNAYDVMFFLCVGGPAWLASDPYDIEAKPDSATTEQLQKLSGKERVAVQHRMQQALLADRLKLQVHFETREMPIFALVVAKGGLKMHEGKAGDTYANGLKLGDGKPLGKYSFTLGNGIMKAQGIPMDSVAGDLAGIVGHLVENRTGLTGAYDFTLQYSASDPPPPDSSAPSIYTALEEQLGLKLESAKGPVQVLVIDHVERPSGN